MPRHPGTGGRDGARLRGQLALVEVEGVARRVNIGMLELDEQDVAPGHWVLIHMGFAVERTDAAGRRAGDVRVCELMGGPRDDA